MLRATFITLSCIVVASCRSPSGETERTSPPDSAAPSSLEQEIAEIVPELLDEYDVPGASAAVVVDGEVELV